jgi:hypothetical protein
MKMLYFALEKLIRKLLADSFFTLSFRSAITSLEWHKEDSTVFASSGADDQVPDPGPLDLRC